MKIQLPLLNGDPDTSSVNLDFWSVGPYELNQDGLTYTVHLNWIGNCPRAITPLQGKMILHRQGIYEQVEADVNAMGFEAQLYFNSALEWFRLHPLVIAIGDKYGLDLDEMFTEASKIE